MIRSEEPGRNGILVLGMHRSGTSALTGVLAAVGVAAPKTPIGGDEWNSRGYWESARVNNFNERLLSKAGSAWNDWTRFEPGCLDTKDAARFLSESSSLLRSEFGAAELFALKDPRICRIVPFWLDAIRALGVTPSVVLALRHPAEVALSLQRRDGMPCADGVMLWLRSILDAENDSRGVRRSFTRYDDLLSNWRSTVGRLGKDLAISWPISLDQAGAEVEKFISRDLKHNNSRSLDDLELPEALSKWASEVWGIVSSLAGDAACDENSHSRLDEVRVDFDLYCRVVLMERGERNVSSNVFGSELADASKHERQNGFSLGEMGERIKNHRRYWTARLLLLAAPMFAPEYAERLRRRLERYEAQGKIERKTLS